MRFHYFGMKTEITCTGTKVNFVPVSCAQMQRNNLLYGDGMNYCSGMKVIIDIYVNSPLQMKMLSLVNIFLCRSLVYNTAVFIVMKEVKCMKFICLHRRQRVKQKKVPHSCIHTCTL